MIETSYKEREKIAMTKTKTKKRKTTTPHKHDHINLSFVSLKQSIHPYTNFFKNKTVFCNCDDSTASNFFTYFSRNFHKLRLTKLITTTYRNLDPHRLSEGKDKQGVVIEYLGSRNKYGLPDDINWDVLRGDGDFAGKDSLKILEEQADIVATLPPQSLFVEFIELMLQQKKDFLIIGCESVLKDKTIKKWLKDNTIYMNTPSKTVFIDDNGDDVLLNACWFSNMDLTI